MRQGRRSTRHGATQHGATRFRSLLVPSDLTPTTDRALERLASLPLADDARVTLLHVVPRSLRLSDQQDAERDAHRALAADALHLRESLPESVTIQTSVSVGVAAEEIAACAMKERAELIVMGRGRRGVLRDTFLSSFAERVIRQARVPVLVVRLRPRAPYGRPALALDLDQAAHEIVRLMLMVVPPPRPRVEVIHGYEVPYRGTIYPSLSETGAAEAKRELQLQATRRLEKLLADAVAEAGVAPEDVPSWKMHVRDRGPHEVVRKAIAKADTDLLVLGTRGHSGAALVFLGSVAGDLLRDATCDVLLVPPLARRASGKASIRDPGAG